MIRNIIFVFVMAFSVSRVGAYCADIAPNSGERDQRTVVTLEQLREATRIFPDGTARMISPNGDVRIYSRDDVMSKRKFIELAKRYRNIQAPKREGPEAAERALCDFDGQPVFLGVYGSWLIGEYMGDPGFWQALQLDYLNRLPRKLEECQRMLTGCLTRAKDATDSLSAWCGVAAAAASPPAGLGLAVGSACLAGAIWARGRAEDDCWNSYTRCMVGSGPASSPVLGLAEQTWGGGLRATWSPSA